MFMQRLLTSLVLIPLVLLTLFYAPTWFLLGLLLIILIAAGLECWHLIPLNTILERGLFLAFLLLCFWGCGEIFSYWLGLGLLFWGFAFIAIITFPKSQVVWGQPLIVAFAFLLLLPLFLQGLSYLYFLNQGKALILLMLCIVWAADIGAYLFGKSFGKHKLIPQVSPGKSWEGAFGGFILVLIVASIGGLMLHPKSWLIWYVLAAFITIISIFGDLLISILKRRCHLKDTGSLIPGHGGVLDRLDSLIAATPFFYCGIKYCF